MQGFKMGKTKIPEDIKKLTFEQALAELDEIVSNLEQGSNKLDKAIGDYERGSLLRTHCEQKLFEAKEKIEQIKIDESGNLVAEPSNIE